jgi:hypothetical protein
MFVFYFTHIIMLACVVAISYVSIFQEKQSKYRLHSIPGSAISHGTTQRAIYRLFKKLLLNIKLLIINALNTGTQMTTDFLKW